MKKLFAYMVALLFLFSVLPVSGPAEEAKLKIVTTIFPIYDWVRETAAGCENADITMLLDSGVDLHSFQPTAADIMKIATCDVFIYVGGESDEWAEDALAEAVNPGMIVINLIDVLGENAKAEETVEGMEEGEEDEEGGKEETEIDEHVWLSLRNGGIFVSAFAGALGKADPVRAGNYAANAEAYKAKLADLDAKYRETVETAAYRTLLFGDRFPFRYLTDDYGLSYYAAFAGCSAETEASFETVLFLAKKADELRLPAVMTIEGTKHRIAETVVSSTAEKNQKILTLDSMQGITAGDVQKGVSYLQIMEENLAVLKEALN